MKLLTCHIENFGRLSDVTIDFTDGVNVICKENGWGKSTLGAFFKAMFYGFDSKKERNAIAGERKLYEPWQGGTYGGELLFETGEKRFWISRTFGKSERTDAFQLFDAETNLPDDTYSRNIGEELFGLDRASFARSIFIAQSQVLAGTTDAINAKLGNLAENTNDINNYETAAGHIRDEMNRLTPDRATGSIKKRKNELTGLAERLRALASAEEAFQEKKRLLTEKEKEKAAVSEKRSALSGQLKEAGEAGKKEALKKQHEQLCYEEAKKNELYRNMRARFPGGVPKQKALEEALAWARTLGEYETTEANFSFTEAEKEAYQSAKQRFYRAAERKSPGRLAKAEKKVGSKGAPDEDFAQLEREIDRMKAVSDEADEMQSRSFELDRKQLLLQNEIEKQERELISLASPDEEDETEGAGLKNLLPAVLLLISGIVAIGVSLGNEKPVLPPLSAGGLLLFAAIVSFALTMKKRREQKSKRQQEKAKKRKAYQEKESALQHLKRDRSQLVEEMKEQEEEAGQKQKAVLDFLAEYEIPADAGKEAEALYELKNEYEEYRRGKDKEAQACAARAQADELEQRIKEFLRGFEISPQPPFSSQLSGLLVQAADCRSAYHMWKESREKLDAFEAGHARAALQDTGGMQTSVEDLNRQIAELDDTLEAVMDTIGTYKMQLEDLQEELDKRDELEEELEEKTACQEREKKRYETLKLTQQYLQAAKEQFTARYMAPISDGFAKYYHFLTALDEKESKDNWMVDANMELKVKEQGQFRETGWLSTGCKDLIGFCMRLALVDAMYQEEKPFLLLDDPFVNLDAAKTAQGNKLIEKLGESCQVIYFTCHDSRMPK